jgi:hypothetical protein
VNFPVIGAHGSIGDLPAVSLPLIAAVLGAFFELDNTDRPSEDDNPKKVASAKGRQRVAVDARQLANAATKAPGDETDDDAELDSRRTKR